MKWVFATKNDWVLTMVRLVLGGVIWAHGAQKMLGWFGGYGWNGTIQGMSQGMGIPEWLVALVVIGEFFGGLALMLGFMARFSAFINAVIITVAAVLVHLPNGFFTTSPGVEGTGFEFHLVYVALALVTTVKGAGALSLDRWIAGAFRETATRRSPVPTAGARA